MIFALLGTRGRNENQTLGVVAAGRKLCICSTLFFWHRDRRSRLLCCTATSAPGLLCSSARLSASIRSTGLRVDWWLLLPCWPALGVATWLLGTASLCRRCLGSASLLRRTLLRGSLAPLNLLKPA